MLILCLRWFSPGASLTHLSSKGCGQQSLSTASEGCSPVLVSYPSLSLPLGCLVVPSLGCWELGRESSDANILCRPHPPLGNDCTIRLSPLGFGDTGRMGSWLPCGSRMLTQAPASLAGVTHSSSQNQRREKHFQRDLYSSRKTSSGPLRSSCSGSVTGGAKLKWPEDLQHGHHHCLLFLATFCWTPLLVTGQKEETSSFLLSPGSSLRNKAVPHFTKNKMQQ